MYMFAATVNDIKKKCCGDTEEDEREREKEKGQTIQHVTDGERERWKN